MYTSLCEHSFHFSQIHSGSLCHLWLKVLALKDYIIRVSKSRGQENVKKLDGKIEFGNSVVVKLDVSGETKMWHQNETEESGNDSKPMEAPCQAELRNVIKEMKAELNSVYDRKERVDKMERNAAVGDWKPRGVLVAHLAEHQGGVTKLAAIPDTTLVASASIDGTLRIWDCAKMESGKNLANRARQVRFLNLIKTEPMNICYFLLKKIKVTYVTLVAS